MQYIFYILIFIVFVIIRANYLINENEIISIEFKSLALASCSFPFGILKETILKDYFLPAYYFLIHYLIQFFNNVLAIKIFNSIISLINIFLIIKIGKQILNRSLGYFLGILFAINHFYLYYTDLIAPYCLIFLVGTILIKTIIDFINKPNKKHFLYLTIANCIFILVDNIGFLYVIPELFLLYKFYENRKFIKKNVIKIAFCSFFAFLATFTILIIQYYNWTNTIIPNTNNGVGLNFNSLYLMINEFLSPYMSFNVPSIQTKSTIGMLYSFALNPNFKSLNSTKLFISLFYSSILPLCALLYFSIVAYKKNFKLKFIFLIAILNFLLTMFFMMYEIIDTSPIYLTQLFITSIILLGYGICKVKDKFLKTLVVFCLFAIQFINPEANSFNLTINKNYPTINAFSSFIKEYNISKNDLVIMPFMGQYGAMYWKELNFFNFDYSLLQKNTKKSMIRNLSNKNTTSINKNNINTLIEDYLTERTLNDYIAKYFLDNYTQYSGNKIIIFIDKLNSKPLSDVSIIKAATMDDYNTKLRKIDFRNNAIQQNKTKLLYEAIKSKTLYNFVGLIETNFTLEKIVQYKKVDNECYKLKTSTRSIYKALNSYESDYVFLIFKTYR